MKEVNLSDNKLDVDMTAILSTCLPNIDELNVRNCQLNAIGIENISHAIRQKTIPVNLQ